MLPSQWQRRFGRSSECHSYMNVLRNQGTFTLAGCPASPSYVKSNDSHVLPAFLPPGYPPSLNGSADYVREKLRAIECCRFCGVRVPRVHIYYFPDTDAAKYCESQGRKVGFAGDPAGSNSLPGVMSAASVDNVEDLTTTVFDGHTL